MATIKFVLGDLTDGSTLADDYTMLIANLDYLPSTNAHSRTAVSLPDTLTLCVHKKEGLSVVNGPKNFGAGDIKKNDELCLSPESPILKVLGVA